MHLVLLLQLQFAVVVKSMAADVITNFITDIIKFSNNELAVRKKASKSI